jgi:hypothetical protein
MRRQEAAMVQVYQILHDDDGEFSEQWFTKMENVKTNQENGWPHDTAAESQPQLSPRLL